MEDMEALYHHLKSIPARYDRLRGKFEAFAETLEKASAEMVKNVGVTDLKRSPARFDFRYLNRSYGARLAAPPLAVRVPLEFFEVTRPEDPAQVNVLDRAYIDANGRLFAGTADGNPSLGTVDNQYSAFEQLMRWLAPVAGI